ncbi:arginine--tRNA ligase, cytoplasmic-like protein isoform X1 [Tanacetum coccineum]
MRNLPANDIIEQCSVAGPGYVNVILSEQWMAQSIHRMLINGIDTWAPKHPVKRLKCFEETMLGIGVLRMLLEYLFEQFPNGEVNDQAIGEIEVVKLIDLLDEAKTRCKAALVERVWTDERLEQTAEALGYGAVKYADLKNNRLTNYKFNYDQMLSDKIGPLKLEHDLEHKLGLHLLRFPECIMDDGSYTLEFVLFPILGNNMALYLENLNVNGFGWGNFHSRLIGLHSWIDDHELQKNGSFDMNI